MTDNELQEILNGHSEWLKDPNKGKKADLRNANLCGKVLKGVNLMHADLSGADLTKTVLKEVNLSHANLHHAIFYETALYKVNLNGASLCETIFNHANLEETNLKSVIGSYASFIMTVFLHCNLSEASFMFTNMTEAIFKGSCLRKSILTEANLKLASLHDVDLFGAILYGANLYGAIFDDVKNINDIIVNNETLSYFSRCPEKGEYIAFKSANGKIIELLIPSDAKRSSATSNKCRASKAKVLSITYPDGEECEDSEVASDRDSSFIYKVGKTVEVPDFDDNRWNECSKGIHHFMTREEAVIYGNSL